MSAGVLVSSGPVISQHNCDMKKDSTTQLLSVQEVPDFAKEISIETGYRACLGYDGCLKSIFKLHNETVNIWTHLLGFVFFFGLMVKDLLWAQEHIRDKKDYNATLLQLLTYQACMMSSSLFHTMSCHTTRSSWQRLDHVSIMVALYGTYVRVIINNFTCFPQYQSLHLAVVTILFGSVIFLKTVSGTSGPTQKASLPLFLGLALYSIAPFIHWVQLSHFIENSNVTSLMIYWMVFPYVVAGLGFFFYVSHYPEKLFPGQVDLYGNSHQIWHVLIFAGMASWYFLSCWVSTTRPEKCILSKDLDDIVSYHFLNNTFPSSSWL